MNDTPTPRTAAVWRKWIEDGNASPLRWESEQLECELAAAKREIDELSRSIRQQQLIDEEILGLRERICRLEAAGDEMAFRLRESVFSEDEAAIEEWIEAKEAKL